MTGIYDFYAALVESSDDAIVAKDVSGIVISWNPAAERLFGWTSEEMVGGSIRRLLPTDRQHEEDDILERIRVGERVGQFLTKRLHKSGKHLDISVTVSPVHDETGTVVGASKIARDAGPELKRQSELLQSKARFETLANNIASLCWMADPDGHLFWYNQRWYDFTGTTFEQMDGWGWEQVQHPDHLEQVKAGWVAKLQSGEEWEDTFPLRSSEGKWRWFLSHAKPIRDKDGRIIRWFGTNTDITEQRDQAEQIRLLLMEVNHRSKNMLSTIQALLRRSIDGNDEFVASFSERIRSMALHQDMLVKRQWREVPLGELVEGQLGLGSDAPGTLTVDVPPLSLSPRAAEVIGMALHELSTNSLKYGALSAKGGRVTVAGEVVGDTLTLTWSESGGPKVSPPTRKGFGTTLINDVPRRFFGGEAGIDFAPEGITWKLVAPLEMVVQGGQQG
ncbi:MAG: PAS domain S-box protein [Alteraurantiacibacter sp.]